jgi:N-acetylglucosaminyl-diphospho-decaprenol L-rhamnosyltransferase
MEGVSQMKSGEEIKGLSIEVAVIIVSFRNAHDVVRLLKSLSSAYPSPSFEIFISENGGGDAMDNLLRTLTTDRCCVLSSDTGLSHLSGIVRHKELDLLDQNGRPISRVYAAEMPGNLGYAGAINSWLRPLLRVSGWDAVWILNPDTQVAPSALRELADHSSRYAKGMVGSRLIGPSYPNCVHTRGLRWRKLLADTLAVDYLSPSKPAPDPEDVDRRIEAPSGASCYVTRELVERIGLMDERYFLFYEDLEWGYRANQYGGAGYAHASIVFHKGGTTIGTATTRANKSPLSVYLEFRNRILFVRDRHRSWLWWTIVMQVAHVLRFGAAGAFKNMGFAARGLLAGVLQKTGRPDHILLAHNRRSHEGSGSATALVPRCSRRK